jgi:hypothetical protein
MVIFYENGIGISRHKLSAQLLSTRACAKKAALRPFLEIKAFEIKVDCPAIRPLKCRLQQGQETK